MATDETKILEEKIDNQGLKIDQQGQEISKLYADITEIKQALLGNEYNQSKGVVKRIDELDKRLIIVEKYIDRWKWFLIGLSLAAGIGTASILEGIAKFISKF